MNNIYSTLLSTLLTIIVYFLDLKFEIGNQEIFKKSNLKVFFGSYCELVVNENLTQFDLGEVLCVSRGT